MRNHTNSNKLIQQGVAVCDFLLTNILVLAFLYIPSIHIDDSLEASTKVFILTANFGLIIAEYFFHTIIHVRKLKTGDILGQVASLTIMQSGITFFIMKVMGDYGGMFGSSFSTLWHYSWC